MEELIPVISQVGFPIAVAAWFMITGHKDSQQTTQAINEMSKALEKNTMVIEHLIKDEK